MTKRKPGEPKGCPTPKQVRRMQLRSAPSGFDDDVPPDVHEPTLLRALRAEGALTTIQAAINKFYILQHRPLLEAVVDDAERQP